MLEVREKQSIYNTSSDEEESKKGDATDQKPIMASDEEIAKILDEQGKQTYMFRSLPRDLPRAWEGERG